MDKKSATMKKRIKTNNNVVHQYYTYNNQSNVQKHSDNTVLNVQYKMYMK